MGRELGGCFTALLTALLVYFTYCFNCINIQRWGAEGLGARILCFTCCFTALLYCFTRWGGCWGLLYCFYEVGASPSPSQAPCIYRGGPKPLSLGPTSVYQLGATSVYQAPQLGATSVYLCIVVKLLTCIYRGAWGHLCICK